MNKITKEEFDIWKENPVTMWVFDFLREHSADCQNAWLQSSWNEGQVQPELLADLRARSKTAQSIIDCTFEGLSGEEEPEEKAKAA